MVRGMSRCRLCGKPVPSIYRKRHESVMCLKMRFECGDLDVKARFPNGISAPVRREEAVEHGQLRLFEAPGVLG
jgi:hypothetical protein